MLILNFDYSPDMPIIESQLQMVTDYCNDKSEVKNAILYYHSNDTHSIDNIDCKWKLHQNYPNSEYLCIPYIDKWVTGEEWGNQTHIFDKDSCEWKENPEYDALNSKGCPQFCPKEESPSHGGPPIPFYDSELMLSFDSSLYRTVFGVGSPLYYKETSKPVLDEVNCDRYAYWMTEHQKEKINMYEDYPRYPPWGNQIFPLVDYCLENGDLVKFTVENKIQWSFYRIDDGIENEN